MQCNTVVILGLSDLGCPAKNYNNPDTGYNSCSIRIFSACLSWPISKFWLIRDGDAGDGGGAF